MTPSNQNPYGNGAHGFEVDKFMALASPHRWREVREWFPRDDWNPPTPVERVDYAQIRSCVGTCQTERNIVARREWYEDMAEGGWAWNRSNHPFMQRVRRPNFWSESMLEHCGLTRTQVEKISRKRKYLKDDPEEEAQEAYLERQRQNPPRKIKKKAKRTYPKPQTAGEWPRSVRVIRQELSHDQVRLTMWANVRVLDTPWEPNLPVADGLPPDQSHWPYHVDFGYHPQPFESARNTSDPQPILAPIPTPDWLYEPQLAPYP